MTPSRVPRLGPSEAYAPQPPKAQSLASYACCIPTAGIWSILLSIKDIDEYHSYDFCQECWIYISNLLKKSLCSVWSQDGWQSLKWYQYKDWRRQRDLRHFCLVCAIAEHLL